MLAGIAVGWMLFLNLALWPFVLQAGPRIGILGESFNADNEFGINVEILERLFTLISKEKPVAVIFTGNMTLGLTSTPDEKKDIDEPSIVNGPTKQQWPQPGYSYDSNHFKQAIDQFLAIKNKFLGNQVPFYPIVAEHEAFGPDSIQRVLTTFQVKNQAPEEASALAYTFVVEKTLFILFSTVSYNEVLQTTISHQLPSPLMHWIEQLLIKEKHNYDFIFVIGNEPAFSTTMTTAHYEGLDFNQSRRDEFWRILVNNGVTAYFCSKEHLYDRTNRYGIWQIISGGAGAPFYKRQFEKAFYHYLILTLPSKGERLPKVQVYDSQGNLSDEFELKKSQFPIYQLRIS